MIAPEQWYQYQEQYQKYGLDMKPQESREDRENRRRAAREARETAGIEIFRGHNRKLGVLLTLVIVATLIAYIVMTAYAASIRYDISQVQRENNLLWDEIKNLQSSETTMKGVGYIEDKAKKELKMITADTETCVYITTDDIPPAGFADVLKAKAYQ